MPFLPLSGGRKLTQDSHIGRFMKKSPPEPPEEKRQLLDVTPVPAINSVVGNASPSQHVCFDSRQENPSKRRTPSPGLSRNAMGAAPRKRVGMEEFLA